MNLFERLIKRTIRYGTNTGGLFLVGIMLMVCSNVVFRIFAGVIPGTYELVEILIVVVAGFALSDTEIHHRQTRVDMVTSHLPEKLKRWFENGANFIGLVYWAIIAWASLNITMDKAAKGETTDVLNVSIIPFRVIWVLGLVLICLVIIYNMSRNRQELGGRGT